MTLMVAATAFLLLAAITSLLRVVRVLRLEQIERVRQSGEHETPPPVTRADADAYLAECRERWLVGRGVPPKDAALEAMAEMLALGAELYVSPDVADAITTGAPHPKVDALRAFANPALIPFTVGRHMPPGTMVAVRKLPLWMQDLPVV